MSRRGPLPLLVLLGLPLLGGAPARAAGPSFDCLRATSPLETLVCSDPELMRLDGLLGEAYTTRLARLDEAGQQALRAEQRAWLAERRQRCRIPASGPALSLARTWEAAPCLASLYRERLVALGAPEAETPATARASQAGFMHPRCLAAVLGSPFADEPATEVPLPACNRGNRHIPVRDVEGRLVVADGAEDGTLTWFGYRVVGELSGGRRAALTWYSGGGTGVFTSLVAIEQPAPGVLAARVLVPGGDRCNGGLSDAEVAGDDAVEVEAETTLLDFVAVIDPDVPERVTGALSSCSVCCMGTVRRRFDLRGGGAALVSATVTALPEGDRSDEERCALGIVRRAAGKLPAQLDAASARRMVADIVSSCGKETE